MTERIDIPFTPEDLQHAQSIGWQAVSAVAPTLREHFGNTSYEIKNGSEKSWVTYWDKWAQDILLEELASFDSTVSFYAEEGGAQTRADTYWTVDPIDGTNQYARGTAVCTTMLSLTHKGTPLVSVINDFVHGDVYTAKKGEGAFKNFSEPLHVSKREVSHAFLELYANETSAEGQALWRNIEATGAYIVRYAATGFTMVSVARGSSEALVSVRNPSSYEWDVAPGALLIQEAGGTVRSWDGEAQVFDSRKPNFIVANQVAYSALERLVDQSMSSTR